MQISELAGKRVVIWGTGREALAAARLIRDKDPSLPFSFIDENAETTLPDDLKDSLLFCAKKDFTHTLAHADILIKSPGVSLYHPLLEKEKERGLVITSLLNIWIAENPQIKTIAITGTKGKSTTASLLAHVLNQLGQRTMLVGNIGMPVTAYDPTNTDYCVIEASSYQAANFTGSCLVGVIVSLYPEHLNWHGTLVQYYRDKGNLLARCQLKLCESAALDTIRQTGLENTEAEVYNNPDRFHFNEAEVWDGENKLGVLNNAYLIREHNRNNVNAVLAVIKKLGYDRAAALTAMESFKGLPHRQQELGKQDGILFVDDSISTTPQSAIAAMQVYHGWPLTLIAGGQDRGIDYVPLIDFLAAQEDINVVLLGEVGVRLREALSAKGTEVPLASSMAHAVSLAKMVTPINGVILLSPAAPSYDMFKDFIARGHSFARAAGFVPAPMLQES